MNQKIAVVTGSNGFVGSHLVDFLLSKNYKVRCIVRPSSNLKWLEGKPVDFETCGLNDINTLKDALKGAHYIFHIAGTIKALNEEGFYFGNVQLTENVLKAALELKQLERIVITSSLAASGPGTLQQPVNEEKACTPIESYGKSKKQQEALAHSYMDRLPITIVRPPAVFGPRDPETFEIFKAIHNRLRVRIGLFEKRASLVYIGDLVQGLLLAATHPNAKGETFFLGGARGYNWDEISNKIATIYNKWTIPLKVPHFIIFSVAFFVQLWGKITKKAVMLDLEKAKQITQTSWECSSQKAINKIGYAPAKEIDEQLRATIDWYKKEKWL